MARARRSYARDSRGRFASTPGGPARAASGPPKRQARKMGTPPPRRRGLVTQRAAVRRSAAKLKGLDASGSYSGAMKQRGQRAAVTRAANRLQAAQQSGRRRLRPGAQQGVVRPGRGPRVMNPEVMPRDRVPASQRPGSMTSTLRGLMRGLAQADARRIREVEAITGQRVTMPNTPSGAGARVRATAKGGKVADTMRAGLRELAQSDARTAREMAAIVRDATPKVAGAKGGKALRGGKKALPTEKTTRKESRSAAKPANATPPATPMRTQRSTVVPALEGSKKLAPLSPQRRKVLGRAMARAAVLANLTNKAKDELKRAQAMAMPAKNQYSDMTPQARKRALARLEKAEKTYAKLQKSSMAVQRAKLFAEGMAGATKEGYTRYDNAVRRSDIRTPGARSKPATRGKVRIRMPRPVNTVAKPKVAGAKGGKALRGGKKALPAEKTAKPRRRRKPS